jgi:hypothetical protein
LDALIAKSPTFKNVFKDTDAVDNLVFQGKLKDIIGHTNTYINKLFWDKKLQYTFTEKDEEKANKFGDRRPFKLTFDPDG